MGAILKEDINNISDCPENALSVVDGDICCIKWNGQPIDLQRSVHWIRKLSVKKLVRNVLWCLKVITMWLTVQNLMSKWSELLKSPEIQFKLEMKTVYSQKPFLSSHLNKSRLIYN